MADEEFSLKQYFVPFTNVKAVSFIILIGFIVFANSLVNSPVLDDNRYIFNNPDFQSFNILNNFEPNMFNTIGQYRALTSLFFNIESQLFHDSVFFFHVLQISLHILNTILVYFVFRRFFTQKFLVFLLSILFLIRPVQTESVSYISSSGSELFFVFGFLAFLISIQKTVTFKKMLASWPFMGTATATALISNNQTGTVDFDVTSDVQSFISNSSANYGWLIKKTDEGANGRVQFGSRQSSSTPQLIITPQ